jgi:hypothetical protein
LKEKIGKRPSGQEIEKCWQNRSSDSGYKQAWPFYQWPNLFVLISSLFLTFI